MTTTPTFDILQTQYHINHYYRDSKLMSHIASLTNFLQEYSSDYPELRDENNEFLIDIYSPNEIIKKVSSTDISKLKFALNRTPCGATLELFILISLTIISVKPKSIPFLINGLRELFEKTCEFNSISNSFLTITFQDFINYYVNIQRVFDPKIDYLRALDQESEYQFSLSKKQDTSYHEESIKSADYSPEFNYLFTLDEVSDHIRVYTGSLDLIKKIYPNKQLHTICPVQIINFAWTTNQQRLAACLQDFSLSYWEAFDEFTVETTFFTNCIQLRIIFLENLNQWITVSHSNQLIKWDWTKKSGEALKFKTKGKISDIIEIKCLQLIAISSFDKKVTLWDLKLDQNFLVINLDMYGSAHTIRYSESEKILITAGFEKSLHFWQIDITKDYTKVNYIEAGVKASISTFEIFEDFNLLLTLDENGNMRSWNLKTLKLMQTSRINSKNAASKILKLGTRRFCVIGARLHFFQMKIKDRGEKIDHMLEKNSENLILPYLDYDEFEETLFFGTNREIFAVGVCYGKLEKVFNSDNSNIQKNISRFHYNSSEKNLLFVENDRDVMELRTRNVHQRETYTQGSYNIPEKIHGTLYDERNNCLIVWTQKILKVLEYDHNKTLKTGKSLSFEFKSPEFKNLVIFRVGLNLNQEILIVLLSNWEMLILSYKNFEILWQLMINSDNFSQEKTLEVSFVGFSKNYLSFFFVDTSMNLFSYEIDLKMKKLNKLFSLSSLDLIGPENEVLLTFGNYSLLKAEINKTFIVLFGFDGTISLLTLNQEHLFTNEKNHEAKNPTNAKLLEKLNLRINDLFFSIICEESVLKNAIQADSASHLGKNNPGIKTWRAHEKEPLSYKFIFFKKVLLVTLGSDLALKIWDPFNLNLMGYLSLQNYERVCWRLGELGVGKRRQKFEKTKGVLEEIEKKGKKAYECYFKDSEMKKSNFNLEDSPIEKERTLQKFGSIFKRRRELLPSIKATLALKSEIERNKELKDLDFYYAWKEKMEVQKNQEVKAKVPEKNKFSSKILKFEGKLQEIFCVTEENVKNDAINENKLKNKKEINELKNLGFGYKAEKLKNQEEYLKKMLHTKLKVDNFFENYLRKEIDLRAKSPNSPKSAKKNRVEEILDKINRNKNLENRGVRKIQFFPKTKERCSSS